jgi:hypothetical protein
VGECLIGICHAVCVFSLLYSGATAIESVKELISETLRKASLRTAISRLFEPSKSQRLSTLTANLGRNLIVCSTDTTRTDLNNRLDVIESFMKGLNGICASLLGDNIKSSIKSPLSYSLFAAIHYDVHSLADYDIAETWIR